jgi:DNA helicase II / ATP-dependent DNA helicase PcrA
MATRIDYAAELNAEQLAAVQAPDGPVLIIAAAGTGKTRTLVYRVAWLVEHGVPADRILLATFTNKAAREMLDRARELVGPSVSGLWGGTFHHMANRILRRNAEVLGYGNDYGIIDSDDQRTLVKQIVEELGLKDKHFPKPDVLLSAFSYAINTEASVDMVAMDRFEHHPIDVHDVVRVHAEYEKRKRTMNAMDFDDILVNCLKLLQEKESVRIRYQEQFRYIMVDEFQDTNIIQSKLMELLADKHRNILVVGDDFQSIYAWRGADFRNIIDFPNQYPEANVYMLQTNYRSVPEILDVANKCIAGNPDQFQKELRAVRDSSKKPYTVFIQNGHQQAQYIIETIRNLQREGYKLSDMAILYRSHFHSMEIQLELTRQRLAHTITSGVRFFEQAHVKDVCSILRLINNPSDHLSFNRLLGLLPGVGPKTVRKIWLQIGERFAVTNQTTRLQVMRAMPNKAVTLWHKIDHFYINEELRKNPSEIVHLFNRDFYDQFAKETFDNYDSRKEDINELIDYTTQFDSLDNFLSELALVTNMETEEAKASGEEDAIRLSTIHQAKGLEFEIVFVLWLTDGMFPSGRAIDEDPSASEERRLFYVVTTRAKDELYLCVPQSRRQRDGGIQYYSPSRFIEELDDQLVQHVEPGYFHSY